MIHLSKLNLDEDYRKKWNCYEGDFVCLTNDAGERINNAIYRVGGLGGIRELKAGGYFMILKYTEAYYPKSITDRTKDDPKHLQSQWCIIDKNGVEKVVFEHFAIPYLVKGSCIYSLNSTYYNIETGELYATAYSVLDSENYLFLDNKFDKDESRAGIMKINKKDGSFEIIK